MPTQLKNMAITFLSLVKKGANDRKIIIKSADVDPTIEFTAPILKIDKDNRRFFSIVYPANEVDKQGEFADPEEIQKTAYGFMKNLRLLNIDKDHSYVSEDAFVAESWIVQKGDPTFPDEPEGSWAVGIIIEDDDTWDQVEKGEIEAISMGGTGDKIEDQEVNKALDYKSARTTGNLWEKVNPLETALRSIFDDDEITDKKKAIGDSVDQFKADLLSDISKDDSLVKVDESIILSLVKKALKKLNKKGGPEMEDKDKKEVQEMIDGSIKKAVEELPKPLSKDDMTVIVKEAVKPLNERVEKVEKTSKGSKLDKDEITPDEDLEKVGAEIAKSINEG